MSFNPPNNPYNSTRNIPRNEDDELQAYLASRRSSLPLPPVPSQQEKADSTVKVEKVDTSRSGSPTHDVFGVPPEGLPEDFAHRFIVDYGDSDEIVREIVEAPPPPPPEPRRNSKPIITIPNVGEIIGDTNEEDNNIPIREPSGLGHEINTSIESDFLEEPVLLQPKPKIVAPVKIVEAKKPIPSPKEPKAKTKAKSKTKSEKGKPPAPSKWLGGLFGNKGAKAAEPVPVKPVISEKPKPPPPKPPKPPSSSVVSQQKKKPAPPPIPIPQKIVYSRAMSEKSTKTKPKAQSVYSSYQAQGDFLDFQKQQPLQQQPQIQQQQPYYGNQEQQQYQYQNSIPQVPINLNGGPGQIGVLPPRSSAFQAPFIPLHDPKYRQDGSGAPNLLEDDDGLRFSFNPGAQYATQVSFTVEPRKRPVWQTMMNCGFTPVIYCSVPPCCLPGGNTGGGCGGGGQQQIMQQQYMQQQRRAPQESESSEEESESESEEDSDED